MKAIASYIGEYFLEEWNPRLFLSVGAFLVLCFILNYGFDFETRIISRLGDPVAQTTFYFFFYGIPFAVTLALYALTSKRSHCIRDRKLWVASLVCFALLAAYISLHNFPLYLYKKSPSLLSPIPGELHWYIIRYLSNLVPGFVMFIPVATYWYMKDRGSEKLYGFSVSNINLKTYFLIILFLAPIVVVASFTSDFQAAYPRYKFGLPQNLPGSERTMLVGLFELCYGVDFVFVEFFFRGFMVIALSRYLGKGSILPMVVVYAFIHFQKPMGEAIGSIAGGLILGIISSRTRSIYGGIILHLGVAYIMEIAGSLHILPR